MSEMNGCWRLFYIFMPMLIGGTIVIVAIVLQFIDTHRKEIPIILRKLIFGLWATFILTITSIIIYGLIF